MKSHSQRAHIGRTHQAADYHRHNEYEKLQDAIFDKTGIHSTVVVTPDHVSIKVKGEAYADFILAKNAIKDRVGEKPIIKFEASPFRK